MAVPWLRLLDTALGLADLARGGRRPPAGAARPDAPANTPGGALDQAMGPGGSGGTLETRLAGVVVAALQEAFNRDHQRLQLERDQLDAERQRAERALKLELIRQSGDREIGRLRLLAGVALVSWLGTLFFSPRVIDGAMAGRVLLALGWLLLLGALGAAFNAQSTVARRISQMDERSTDSLADGSAGAIAPWLLVAGLASVAMAVLFA
jgi:hypothetical protein